MQTPTETRPATVKPRASRAAVEETYEDVRPFLEKLAFTMYDSYHLGRQGVDPEDVRAEVNLAFCQVYHEFDPSRGKTLEKFLSVRVWQKVTDAYRVLLKWRKRDCPKILPFSGLDPGTDFPAPAGPDPDRVEDPTAAGLAARVAAADSPGAKPHEVRHRVREGMLADGYTKAEVREAFRSVKCQPRRGGPRTATR